MFSIKRDQAIQAIFLLSGQCQVKKPVLGQNISRGCYFMKTGLIFWG